MIYFLIVIYNITPSECLTLRTLRESLGKKNMGFRILVLDNTINPIKDNFNCDEFEYYQFHENLGLSRAYKHGAMHCLKQGAKFIATLDQDSIVTLSYINAVTSYAKTYTGKNIVLCPRIFCKDRQISPFTFNSYGFPCYGTPGKLHAINSFTVYSELSIKALESIDNFYWLDALDFVIFETLHKARTLIIEMPIDVQHNLSLLENSTPQSRLNNIIYYEAAFLLEYCNPIRILSGIIRLTGRIARHTKIISSPLDFLSLFNSLITGSIKGIKRRKRNISNGES